MEPRTAVKNVGLYTVGHARRLKIVSAAPDFATTYRTDPRLFDALTLVLNLRLSAFIAGRTLQNSNRTPNWKMREKFACEVICPKVDELMLVWGP